MQDFFLYILEKEMASHSSILAWKIPWTEEPQGLQSTGLQETDTTWRLRRATAFHNVVTGTTTNRRRKDLGVPSRPVARAQGFHYWGQGSVPGQGTRSSKLRGMAKKHTHRRREEKPGNSSDNCTWYSSPCPWRALTWLLISTNGK